MTNQKPPFFLNTLSFIDPKGLLHIRSDDPKVEFYKTIKELEIKNSQKVIALITSNKYGKVKSTQFGTWNDVDVVITDKGIPKEWVDFFKDREIELFIV